MVELVENWRIEDGLQTGRGGRPQYVTIRTAIVLWVHVALTKRPQLVARMSEVVAFGMKPYMRDYFSLVNENVDLSIRDGRMDYNNDWYHRIWRALERVRATMEPYPSVSRHGRHTVDEWLEFMDLFGLDSKKTSKKNYEPTEEELLAEKRMARCDEFSNRLLWATVEKFGDKLGSWNGDVAVDGTAFKVSANGNPNKQDMLAGKVPGHRKVASTPTLGNYSKGTDDHNGDAKPSKGDNMWAGEATFAAHKTHGRVAVALLAGRLHAVVARLNGVATVVLLLPLLGAVGRTLVEVLCAVFGRVLHGNGGLLTDRTAHARRRHLAFQQRLLRAVRVLLLRAYNQRAGHLRVLRACRALETLLAVALDGLAERGANCNFLRSSRSA